MTPDEIKEILEADEPSEEFVGYALEVFSNKWMVTSFEGDSTCWGYREIAFRFYQKGIRDTQREPVKPELACGYHSARQLLCEHKCRCRVWIEKSAKFCSGCGAPVDWSE